MTFSAASTGTRLSWILRIGLAGCYIGHGAFGIITKAAWVPYFATGGISEPLAWKLMPVIGTMDIVIGVAAFWRPCRALFVWAAVWSIWTALLRPLSGEPFWEALERAGNYGVPLSALVFVGWHRPWLTRLPWDWTPFLDVARPRLDWTLRVTTCALLAGHAGLGFFSHKAGLAHHYAAIGASNPDAVVPLIGAFEFILAGCVLVFPHPAVVLAACAWKIATESLFVFAGAPFWEVIERFGSFTAPLALGYLLLSRNDAVGVRRENKAPNGKRKTNLPSRFVIRFLVRHSWLQILFILTSIALIRICYPAPHPHFDSSSLAPPTDV